MRIGIFGYGNLGKGVELAIKSNNDMELVAVFTRRKPSKLRLLTDNVPIVSASDVLEWREKIDVLIICAGSATDLPVITPSLAKYFNVVDSYDNHSNIINHYRNVNESAVLGNKTALISCGWDPGIFSLFRLYSKCILPDGNCYTFWGRGVSQGHSEAIRKIEGVIDARQYTVPTEKAIEKVRSGENPKLTNRDKHIRECYVVINDEADKERIRKEIINMPGYFADYDTFVTFISMEEMIEKHSDLPHGGNVIYSGRTGGNSHTIEYSLLLDSNPEFTGSVLVAFARAVNRMADNKKWGCKTVFDIAPVDLIYGEYKNFISNVL